ncbi:MAG TPA: thiamine pyrophosphate-binding protein [Acidobacteriaceae bacterium]|jgi:acetolactate synthase-1/2/3 large subunit|nr:thiamine pyrophosphate-binding protein [Acidobacteriaceae bacterium]
MKMRVADYIAKMFVAHGISDVFMVTGGGAMHLNDAFGRCEGLHYLCCHHEQACAMAAESYSRVSGRIAALNVTTGPGGINALNGVFGAYVDSIGMVIVSGQVKKQTIAQNYPLSLRQLGDQEANIVSMVRPITKYATVLQDPLRVREVIEKSIWLARNGRPGPVWVDVPIDVQAALVDPENLIGFDHASLLTDPDIAPNTLEELHPLSGEMLASQVREAYERLCQAKRPVIFAGAGIRLAGAHDQFLNLADRLHVPVVTGWNAHDALPNDHPHYAGRPGSVGDRAGNFAVQNADFLLVLGSRLNIRQVSYNWESFARSAYIVAVDIDHAELAKPTLHIAQPLHVDLRVFLDILLAQTASHVAPTAHLSYLAWCRARVARYPVVLPEYWQKDEPVNPYCFVDQLFSQLEEGDIIVAGDGTACVTAFQAAHLRRHQRMYTNSGSASMGYDLPAAIGAWHATHAKRIICLAGDGSLMMNLQELQTISGAAMPIKIFILNNGGYHSIRQTQQAYFPDNIVGCGLESGLSFPDFQKLAAAFNIPARQVKTHSALDAVIHETINEPGPQICEVFLDQAQAFAPKLASRRLEDGSMVSSPLEDLSPFLSREELAENLLPLETPSVK